MKTSSRILGTALFLEGFAVQDAPKYGAERRGAPMTAYVRADRKPVFERGIIHNPDLVVVADESLLSSVTELITEGLTDRSLMLVNSSGNISEWKEMFSVKSETVYLPLKSNEHGSETVLHLVSTACAAAAAALTGVVSAENVLNAVREEHSSLSVQALKENIEAASYAYEKIKAGTVRLKVNENIPVVQNPHWFNMKHQPVILSAPSIHSNRTSIRNMTGSWRTLRPEIKYELCSKCTLCSVYCPDNAVTMNDDGMPEIDYNHCKGCLICADVCPKSAIEIREEINPFKRKHYRGEM